MLTALLLPAPSYTHLDQHQAPQSSCMGPGHPELSSDVQTHSAAFGRKRLFDGTQERYFTYLENTMLLTSTRFLQTDVLEMTRCLSANFMVDDRPLHAFFSCPELLSLHTRLLNLEKPSPRGRKWSISAPFAPGLLFYFCFTFHLEFSSQFSPAVCPNILKPMKRPLTLRVHKNTP